MCMLFRSKVELEGKIEDLKTKLSVKDETLKIYVSKLQSSCEKLKEHSKQTGQVINHSLTITSDQGCDVSSLFLIIMCIESFYFLLNF